MRCTYKPKPFEFIFYDSIKDNQKLIDFIGKNNLYDYSDQSPRNSILFWNKDGIVVQVIPNSFIVKFKENKFSLYTEEEFNNIFYIID